MDAGVPPATMDEIVDLLMSDLVKTSTLTATNISRLECEVLGQLDFSMVVYHPLRDLQALIRA
jgi:hypothetical protein